jgi:DNA-binding SARP family transcriptional activator
MFSTIYRIAVEQLQSLGDAFRLVVLHPNYAQQHRLLQVLLQNNAIYVRFEGQKLTHTDLRDQLRAALIHQVERASLLPGDILVLDECDRSQNPELEQFLPEVVEAVGNGRVFMLTRVCPRCVLENDDLRRKTCFLPVDPELMLWDYAQRSVDKPHLLEVRALGTGRVMLNGKLVDTWDGVLPRALFFYLVDKGLVTRNDIFETFWPNLSVREATNVFHVTKRKVSEVLGTDLTNYLSGFYRIAPQIELSYDVVQFTGMVQGSSLSEDQKQIEMLRRAIWLYRDDYLSAMNTTWAVTQRKDLRVAYCDALMALAKLVEKQGNRDEALGLYLRASASSLNREDIVRSIMHLCRDLGLLRLALDVYERLKNELHNNLNVDPAHDLQELAEEIRRMLGGVK